MSMTSRERFLKVLAGEMPDRVPVTLFIQDQGHFLNQNYPGVDPWDYETLQRKVIELQKQLGADVFVRMLFGVNDPFWIHFGGLDVNQQTENWEVKTEERHNGNTLIKHSTIRTPRGTLTQEFSINELQPGTYMYACTQKPIHNIEELEIAIQYEPKMPESWPAQVNARVQKIKAAVGEDGIVGSWSPHGPFNNASLLIDHDILYALFKTDFAYYEKLMNFAMQRILPYTRAIDDAGVDVHCVGGNVPNAMVGKRNYDKFILPFEKRYIDFVQQNGTPAMYHNCGQVMALVESYKELGVRIAEPFSPFPLGDADLSRVKEMVAGDYIILSGIDQVNVLQKGSIDQVKRATEQAIKTGKPGGKFILQPVDFLEYGTPIENVAAYVRTALEYAAY
jgi:uroporphyrinogen-III decarboxylase